MLLTLAFSLDFAQINAKTDLALRYNDISPLENHHCAVAFGILSKVKTMTRLVLGKESTKKNRRGVKIDRKKFRKNGAKRV